MSTDFDEEDRSSIIYPKAFYTWKSEIRYTGWYIELLLREYLKYLNYRQNCSSGIFIIIYAVDRLANKNLHHVFVKKNWGCKISPYQQPRTSFGNSIFTRANIKPHQSVVTW